MEAAACIQRSLTMEEEAVISSEDTVEMEAAMGPTMATPASTGGRQLAMAGGMMPSTLP